MSYRIVTIDGPAGAGKTTVSKLLSSRLGCIYVDTGSLYRAVAFESLAQKVSWENKTKTEDFLKNLSLNFVKKGNSFKLESSGKDISPFIRTSEISMLASSVSAKPEVRRSLLDIQRDISKNCDTVFEGRDMGTIVFPDADFKFFLFADIKIRSLRRFNEMPKENRDLVDIEKEMKVRDYNDSTRKEAPLKPASDAILIDSTNLTVEQVVEKMLKNIEND